MITDRETNTVYFSDLLKSDPRFSRTCKEITHILKVCQVDFGFLPNTRDIWARDFMPVQIAENSFIEYRYDPDYLQGEDNRIIKTYPDIVCDAIGMKTIKSDIVIDGGNIIKSKNTIILTDKILVENEGIYQPAQLIDKLKELFEVENIVLIPWDEKNDYFGHADGMIRFVEDKKVILQGYFNYYPKKFKDKLFNTLKENNIEWISLKYNVPKEDINKNWAYINFLQTKDLIIIPKLGIDEDEQALLQFKSIFADYAERERIFQVDMGAVVEEGGALNCISWTIKRSSNNKLLIKDLA